ncbi:MAG TPA: glycoside hydrolase family 28 protein [Clostridia bacterium]
MKYLSLYNIIDFGAVPDENTLCTDAFEMAVRQCEQSEGGTIYVPAGRFHTGPIRLVSNVNLYLDAGAVLLFSNNINDFPTVYSRWEGEEMEVYSPLIYGKDVENVSVTGHGTLDGQGAAWWELHRNKRLKYPRPRFICFEDSTRVLIDGIKIINSPAWTINPVRCNNVTISGVTIVNPAESPNTDGINPDSCENVHIHGCHVDVGDDCITLKSGVEYSRFRIPCKNITISDCTLIHGHGGVVIGSEMSGGVQNVVISNCIFEGTDRGIRLKSRRGRGGTVEDIHVDNIVMKNVMCPIVMNLYYHCGKGGKESIVSSKTAQPINNGTPCFRRIHISSVTSRETSACAGFCCGLPEMPVEDISFHNINIHMAQDAEPGIPAMMDDLDPMRGRGFYFKYMKNAVFNNVRVEGHEGNAFTIEDCTNVRMVDCTES